MHAHPPSFIAHKDLFKTGMNTRCHLRGSVLLLLLLRLGVGEKKELLRNSRGCDLSVLVRSGEVSLGPEGFSLHFFDRLELSRRTDH